MVQEHLRLVDQAAKGSGMHDAVTIALVFGARGRWRLWIAPPAGPEWIAGVGLQQAAVLSQIKLQRLSNKRLQLLLQ
jgi:hypothetical protein